MTSSKSYIAMMIQKYFLLTQLSKIGTFGINPFRGIEVENIYVTAQDNILIGVWVLRHPKPKGCIMFLHGHASNREDAAVDFELYRLVRRGYTVVIPDYREYGDSGGVFEVSKVNYDIAAVRKYCFLNLSLNPAIIGFSLGGAIALEYCKYAEFTDKVILISTFSSSEDILEDFLIYQTIKFFKPSIQKELKTKFNYDSNKNIALLNSEQVLVIHSAKDKFVKIKHAKKLVETSNCRYWYTENDSHMSIMMHQKLIEVIDNFLSQ